ncbi:senecionine N-oxygenase-like [Malaya genurostris]|uniref:senecionine N-oxygenase-like n=1 Tax=Malaya genurostris TaxID=325434 RepID=UPI0026F3F071|nr:senecionine N-oxygenase-like [Malaya genurostris]
MNNSEQRYCVIGAGVAGVCAGKSALQNGGQVVIFEQTDQIGGTWVYTDATGKDQNDLPIHSSMYEGLWTNLPKEVMGFPDYEMPQQNRSYIHSSEVLRFVQNYASHFGVIKHISFEHVVEQVKLFGSDQWEVQVRNLKRNKSETFVFDFVLVCNGHYFEPIKPKYEGKDKFEGVQLHSHEYRKPNMFKDRNVLLIGAGPSGKDLVFTAAKNANIVFFSHHVPDKLEDMKFPSNVVQVPDVARLHASQVEFVDGAIYAIDIIIYCTGYRYSFPFLHESCEIEIDNNWVKPLYKHVLNINHPTMAFIGIPYYVCTTLMFDLQARFVLKYYSGRQKLPAKSIMIADQNTEMEARWARGLKKRQAHMMGGTVQAAYYDDLAKTVGIGPIPPVMAKMHIASNRRKNEDLLRYREDIFRVLDAENFEIIYAGNDVATCGE